MAPSRPRRCSPGATACVSQLKNVPSSGTKQPEVQADLIANACMDLRSASNLTWAAAIHSRQSAGPASVETRRLHRANALVQLHWLERAGDIPARQHVSECVVVTSSWYSSGPISGEYAACHPRPLQLGMPRTGPYPVESPRRREGRNRRCRSHDSTATPQPPRIY